MDGRVLTFGVSGKLIMNSLVMYDQQTDSLWSQFLGMAVSGPYQGRTLEAIGLTIMEWSVWRELHPDTLVLDQNGQRFTDPYGGYYEDDSLGVIGRTQDDQRLIAKEFVVGLLLPAAKKAYPFRYLSEAPVVNDIAGDADVLVVFDPETAAGVVFDRSVNGLTLTFQQSDISEPRLIAPIVDRETGTLWEGMTGRAVVGQLAGAELQRLPSTHAFWFAWADHYPGAELYAP